MTVVTKGAGIPLAKEPLHAEDSEGEEVPGVVPISDGPINSHVSNVTAATVEKLYDTGVAGDEVAVAGVKKHDSCFLPG